MGSYAFRMSAIVVIDVQKGFLKPEYEDIPERIRAHLGQRDYDHIIFGAFVNRKGSSFERLLDQHNLYGPPETDIAAELAPFAEGRPVFSRTAYSLFKADGFKEYLDEHGVTAFDICGLVSDSCVLATAFEGFDLGYEVTVLRDLMRTKGSLEPVTEHIFKRNIDTTIFDP